jgi:hypothetical protein
LPPGPSGERYWVATPAVPEPQLLGRAQLQSLLDTASGSEEAALNGVKKVVPDAATLETAYRRAAAGAIARRQVAKLVKEAQEQAARLALPRSLARQVKAALKADPALPWDKAVAAIAKRLVKSTDSGEGDSAS